MRAFPFGQNLSGRMLFRVEVILAGLMAVVPDAAAQDVAALAGATALPPVEVIAPQPRRDAGTRPKPGAERGRRSTRRAIITPLPPVTVVPLQMPARRRRPRSVRRAKRM